MTLTAKSINKYNDKQLQLGPLKAIILQGTSNCNLNCSYCYLSEKSRKSNKIMEPDTIRTAIRRVLKSPFVKDKLRICWHSGEPLLLNIDYYRQAIKIILNEKATLLDSDFVIGFDIQSNGTRITQEWCDFIKEQEGLLTIGISCDGPADLHNACRKNWAEKGTHTQTEAGMKLLCANSIPFDITSVVSTQTLDSPEAFIDYFSTFGDHIREFHYNLYSEFFFEPEKISRYAGLYHSFIQRLLSHISFSANSNIPAIRNFTSFYNRLFNDESKGVAYDARSMSTPFKTLSIESDGDVTTFYTGLTKDECRELVNLYGDNRGFSIGNILNDDLEEMANSEKLKQISADFELSHKTCEENCDYYDMCPGGYNLVKHRRFGRFDVSETPECRVHVKTFVDTLLKDINKHIVNSGEN